MSNGTNKSNENKRRRLLVWFGSIGLVGRVALIIMLSIAVVAIAATILWNSTHKTIDPPKARYIEVEIDGIAESYDSIAPGDSVPAAPAIRNEGSVPATAFIKMAVPKASDGAAAYDYTVPESWKEIESSDNGDSIDLIYAFMSEGMLATVYPDGVTDELCDGFTLKSSITGGELYAMESIAIELDGYLVDADEGDDPDTVWNKLGQ